MKSIILGLVFILSLPVGALQITVFYHGGLSVEMRQSLQLREVELLGKSATGFAEEEARLKGFYDQPTDPGLRLLVAHDGSGVDASKVQGFMWIQNTKAPNVFNVREMDVQNPSISRAFFQNILEMHPTLHSLIALVSAKRFDKKKALTDMGWSLAEKMPEKDGCLTYSILATDLKKFLRSKSDPEEDDDADEGEDS